MHFLTKLNQFFGFTPTESKVVFFLVVTFLAGSAVKVYRIYFPLDPSSRFDYTEADKEFAERSKLIDSLEIGSTQDSSARQKTQKPSQSKPGKKGQFEGVININTASKEELMKLPGVGEAMAERILLYREENGKFQNVEELKKVKGIGEKKFEKIRSLVKVE